MRSNLRSESHHDLYYDNTNHEESAMVTYLVVGQVIMDAHVGPRIYMLVADNHVRECTVRRQPLHAYVWR